MPWIGAWLKVSQLCSHLKGQGTSVCTDKGNVHNIELSFKKEIK